MSKFIHYIFTFVHGAVIGLSVLFLILVIGSAIKSYTVIDPQKTYTVVDVTDSNGKIYRNLAEINPHTFRDYHGAVYTFNGNYTAITRQVSGEQFLKEINQPSKSFPIEAIY